MVFSPERILDDARADPNYLGNDDVASRSTWMPAPDGQSEILVPASAANTPADDVEPTVLKMLVQLSGDRFYLTPDGHFNPQNPMPWQVGRSPAENLLSGRGSVILGPVPNAYPILHNEWARYQPHIDTILQAVLPCVSKSGFRTQDGTRVVLKLNHNFFDPRPDAPQVASALVPHNDSEHPEGGDTDEENQQAGLDHARQALEALDDDRDPPFRTVNIPVNPLNQALLLEVAATHVFNPLCVFLHGQRDQPIPPSQYPTLLPGAIAQVTFTLSHRLIRRPKNVSHFTATINEIEILGRPPRIALAPSKTHNSTMFRKRKSPDDAEGPATSTKRAKGAGTSAKRAKAA